MKMVTNHHEGFGDIVIHNFLDQIVSIYRQYKDNEHVKNALMYINSFIDLEVPNVDLYEYIFSDGSHWYVLDNEYFKITHNSEYNQYFNKKTGHTFRFGKTIDDDPEWCPLGPEILDLEISVNGCPAINGHNCKFCYKNNTNAPARNMSLETFRKIVSKFPKNLGQIAFGITGAKTNPDFCEIIKSCRNEFGIVPNYTLSGADIQDLNDPQSLEIYKTTMLYCGAVAVSCYKGAKELCYNTIKMFSDIDNDFFRERWKTIKKPLSVNMHIVLSKDNLDHIMDVLNDIKDGKVKYLSHIVFLRIKPVGRASFLNTDLTYDEFDKVITFCEDNGIGYGFDSCSAKNVIDVFKRKGKLNSIHYCEPCESSKFSSYINVDGQYWHCSFCENNKKYKSVNVLDYDSFFDVWNSQEVNEFRYPKEIASNSCQAYDLDLKGVTYENQK